MRKITVTIFALPLIAILSLPVIAQQKKDPWLHVEVRESKEDPEIIKVNLPFSMGDVALKIAKDKKLNDGRLKLDSTELSVPDLKNMWNEFKKAGNADFVSVEKKNETVKI